MSRDKCQAMGPWALSAADSWLDGEGRRRGYGWRGIKLGDRHRQYVCVCADDAKSSRICLCVAAEWSKTVKGERGEMCVWYLCVVGCTLQGSGCIS